jgi:hypothetical protein
VLPGFRREVAEKYVLLSYYAASSDNMLQAFRDNLSGTTSSYKKPKKKKKKKKFLSNLFNPDDGTNSLFQNVGNKLGLLAA